MRIDTWEAPRERMTDEDWEERDMQLERGGDDEGDPRDDDDDDDLGEDDDLWGDQYDGDAEDSGGER
jgi:hypothetical protein